MHSVTFPAWRYSTSQEGSEFTAFGNKGNKTALIDRHRCVNTRWIISFYQLYCNIVCHLRKRSIVQWVAFFQSPVQGLCVCVCVREREGCIPMHGNVCISKHVSTPAHNCWHEAGTEQNAVSKRLTTPQKCHILCSSKSVANRSRLKTSQKELVTTKYYKEARGRSAEWLNIRGGIN